MSLIYNGQRQLMWPAQISSQGRLLGDPEHFKTTVVVCVADISVCEVIVFTKEREQKKRKKKNVYSKFVILFFDMLV